MQQRAWAGTLKAGFEVHRYADSSSDDVHGDRRHNSNRDPTMRARERVLETPCVEHSARWRPR